METSFTYSNEPQSVRAFRTSLGLNQKALAGLLDVDQATVSRWERGLIPVDSEVQRKLRDVESSIGVVRTKSDPFARLDMGDHWPWLLRFFRTFRNLSQEQLAEIVDCSAETVSRWECGRNAPDLAAQLKLRALVLAPLASDSAFQDMKARLEASAGMYNANWGQLLVTASSGLLRHCEKRGYPSPLLGRVDRFHDGLYEDWTAKHTATGFSKGEVLLSYTHIRIRGDDTRLLITVPMLLETGAVMSIVTNLPAKYPSELEGQINIITADTAIG